MTEKLTEQKTYQVDYVCGTCTRGEMVFTGKRAMAHRLEYQHRCNHCRAIIFLPKRYPAIEYRDT